ncbi:hypothetical protein ACH5RR_025754 [Cinchona calisaya]|uniref:Uncharacterized protein n=1 Tax=Cinchona calisaya TaxID=153742 RepID=A0ABD2Z3S3_9GENT
MAYYGRSMANSPKVVMGRILMNQQRKVAQTPPKVVDAENEAKFSDTKCSDSADLLRGLKELTIIECIVQPQPFNVDKWSRVDDEYMEGGGESGQCTSRCSNVAKNNERRMDEDILKYENMMLGKAGGVGHITRVIEGKIKLDVKPITVMLTQNKKEDKVAREAFMRKHWGYETFAVLDFLYIKKLSIDAHMISIDGETTNRFAMRTNSPRVHLCCHMRSGYVMQQVTLDQFMDHTNLLRNSLVVVAIEAHGK